MSLVTIVAAVTSPASPLIIIDQFTAMQSLSIVGGSGSAFAVSSSAANIQWAVGGQRELALRRDAGRGRMDLDVNVNIGDGLNFSATGNARGHGLVTWDGPDTTPTTAENFDPTLNPLAIGKPNTFGLTGGGTGGGLDLTGTGLIDRVAITAHSDTAGISVYLTFYKNSDNWTTGTIVLPRGVYTSAGDPSFSIYEALFRDFTLVSPGGYSRTDVLRDVRAITLRIDGSSGADVLIDSFAAVATFSEQAATPVPIPEPSTSATGCGAILALGIWYCRAVRWRGDNR